MNKQEEANKRLFNKLFAEMSSIRTIKNPIKKLNSFKFIKSIKYLYYSKKSNLWFGFGETNKKYIYFFGIHENHITQLNTLDNSIMIDFDKENSINENSLGLISENLTVYLNKNILEEKYPTFNSAQFKKHVIQIDINNLKIKIDTIELGQIDGNFIANLNKLIKNIEFTPNTKITKEKRNKSSIEKSMNLFLNSIRAGKSYEDALKIANVGNITVKIWYSKGRKGDEKYKEFYNTFKEIMPRDETISKKMNKIIDLMKTGKTTEESIKIANVTSSELKKWVKYGKDGEVEYLDFYEEYKILERINNPKSNTKEKNKELIKNYIKLIQEGKTNKEAFETLNIPKFKVKNWKKQGQLGNKEYQEFYDTYLKAVKREEFAKINEFIDLINKGKTNEEAMKIIKMPKFKIKQWFNKGKNGDANYIEFYNAYMKQYEKNKKETIPTENIKPTIKKELEDNNEKKCEICGRTLNKKSKDNICKRCHRKQRCANIVQELLPSIDPGVPFKKEDLKKLGLTGMQVQDYIWTLQEFSLIKKEKNKRFSLISKEKIDEFIKESGVEIKETGPSTVKLTKKCETCGKTLEISKFPVSENNPDGYEDNCKNCKKLINTASYLKELLKYVGYEKEFSEDDLKEYYPDTFLLQAKIWSLLDNDLLTKNDETNRYTLTNKEKCEKFIEQYFKDTPQRKPTLTPPKTEPPKTIPKPTTNLSKKQKQMDCILNAMKNGKTRKEAAKLAGISLFRITHWYKEGRDGIGEDNIYFHKQLKNIEEQQINKLKNSMKIVLKVLKSGGSKNKAAKEASIKENEIDEWLEKGKKGLKPYDSFKRKYDKIYKKAIDYNDKNNIRARKIFIENIKDGKTRKEAAKKASLKLKLIDSWIIRGTKGEKPFVEFYNEYSEAREISKDKPNSIEERIKREFIDLLKEGYSHGEASRKIENGTYEQKIKKWYVAGKQGVKIHLKFYLDCQEAKNSYKLNKAKIPTLLSDGFTIKESCEKLNLNPVKIKKDILKGMEGKKPYDKFYLEIIESKTSLIDINQMFKSPNHPHKSQMIDVLELMLIGTSEEEALKKVNVDETTLTYWINRGKREFGELYIEFYQIYNQIKSGDLLKTSQKEIIKEIKRELDEIEDTDADILNPLPKKMKMEFDTILGESLTGFAWVDKIGNIWTYSRKINRRNIKITDLNIYELHKKVIKNNLMWGVRDLKKAKETLEIENNITIENTKPTNNKDILAPLPQNIKAQFSKGTKTGFAWVNKSGNYFYYIRANKNIKIKAFTLEELYHKVITNNLDWGVINLSKAKKTLNESKNSTSLEIPKQSNDILAPLPEEIEKELQRYSKGSKTGFAWVKKSGKKYTYERVVNGKLISIKEVSIEDLHKKVLLRNLTWGVRDIEKAKQTLNEKSFIEKPKTIPKLKTLSKDIFFKFPDEYEYLFKSNPTNKSGIAWVSKNGSKWYYSKQINGKLLEISDNNIFKLHKKVIEQNQLWGIRDYNKAKISLISKPIDDNDYILAPANKKELINYIEKESGFLLVEKSRDDGWEYSRLYNGVKIKSTNIYDLFEKILSKNLVWGVTDFNKAKKTLGIKKLPDEKTKTEPKAIEEVINTDILAPLPKQFENSFKSTKTNKTGIAWVNKVGNQWIYSRRVNEKHVEIKDPDIYQLHKKVISKNLTWGIRDYDKAKEIIRINGKNTSKTTQKTLDDSKNSVSINLNRNIISINGKIKNNAVLKVLTRIYEFGDNIIKLNTEKQETETSLSIELELNDSQINEFESKIKDLGWKINK